ncbi:MAG: WecB/TagA/CpsF family glycosyltransferase [Planctomycetaceae bacterium]|nr:WecB/TagA/CpsF family glycosyltransferase [Planctomycetaceae bacterium]
MSREHTDQATNAAADISQQRLFGIAFDCVTMDDAVDWVLRSVARGKVRATRFVVTPNVNITLQHQHNAQLRRCVADAGLTVADGMPLVLASRLLRKPLPERVAGSDLVNASFDAAIAEMPLRVFLLGAAPGVADRAADEIHRRWAHVEVVGTDSPPPGFENRTSENRRILNLISDCQPDIVVIGLGAPRQEAWAYEHRQGIDAAVTFCVGGTIDFLAGEQMRAPRWMRRLGVEWFWRLATSPRRLFARYANDAVRLPLLVWRELRGQCPTCRPQDPERPRHMMLTPAEEAS